MKKVERYEYSKEEHETMLKLLEDAKNHTDLDYKRFFIDLVASILKGEHPYFDEKNCKDD